MVVTPRDVAGEEQLQPTNLGSFRDFSPPLELTLPVQEDGREVGIEWKFVLLILRFDQFHPTVNDGADDLHAQSLEADVRPFERQHLFGSKADALCHHHHRAGGFGYLASFEETATGD